MTLRYLFVRSPITRSRSARSVIVAKLSLLDSTHKADIDFQTDSGATCNTVAASALRNVFPDIHLLPSRAVLRPYGNGPAIKPVGRATLVCDRQGHFEPLELQVVADKYMSGKPNQSQTEWYRCGDAGDALLLIMFANWQKRIHLKMTC